MSPADPRSASGPARTRRPRVTAAVCLVFAVILGALGAFWATAGDAALVGPASATIALAVVCLLLAVLGFRIGARSTGNAPAAGPVRLVTILAVVIGVAGAALGIIIGGMQASLGAIASGAVVFALSLAVAMQGVLLYGAARYRA